MPKPDTSIYKNRRAIAVACGLGFLFTILTFIDLGLTKALLADPEINFTELNPFINIEEFSANYLPQALVVVIVFAFLVQGFCYHVAHYQETGQLMQYSINRPFGTRKSKFSQSVLLGSMIVMFIRLSAALQLSSLFFFRTDLAPKWEVFLWPFYVWGADSKLAGYIYLLNVLMLLSFLVFLPLTIFTINRLTLFAAGPKTEKKM